MKSIFKNKKNGMVFGVCAGLSDATGIDVTVIRLCMIFGSILSGSVLLWIYLLLGVLLPNKQ